MRTLAAAFVGLLKLAVSLAFVFAVLLALLPWLLSVDGTRAALLSLASSVSGQQILAEEVSLQWFGPQKLKGLYLQDNARNATLRCEEVATDATLWQILAGGRTIGHLRIDEPYLLVRTEQMLPTAPTAFASAGPSLNSLIPLQDFCALGAHAARRFSGDIDIQGGTMEIAGPHIDNVYFRAVQALVKLPKAQESLEFLVQGTTAQREMEGSFNFTGTLTPCIDNQAVLTFRCSAEQLPVLGLDQMVSLAQPQLRGVLYALLGPSLDLSASVLLSQNRGEITLAIASSLAKAAFSATTEEKHIILHTPAHCTFTISPALSEYLFSLTPQLRGTALAASSHLVLSLDSLAVPIEGSQIDWPKLAMKAQLELSDMQFQTPSWLQGLNLNQVHIDLTTDELQKEILADAKVNLHYAEATSAFTAAMQISSPLHEPAVAAFALQTDRFPVVIIDQLLAKKGALVETLGTTLDAHVELTQSGDGPLASLNFSSPHITSSGASLRLKPQIELQKPLEATFTPSETWQRRYLPGFEFAPIHVTLKDFTLKEFTVSALSSATAHLEITADSLAISRYRIPHPQLLVDIEGREHIALKLQADGVNGALQISYDPGKNQLISKKESHLHAELQPASWQVFSASLPQAVELMKPAALDLELHPFVWSLKTGMQETLEGTLALNELVLTHPDKPKSRLGLQNIAMTWKVDPANCEISSRGQGKIAGAAETWSDFQMECRVKNGAEGTSAACKFAAAKLDTTVLDVWMASSNSFAPLLGSPMNIKVDLAHEPNSDVFSLNAKSDRLQLDGGFACDTENLVLRSQHNPFLCNWTISPEGFAIGADLWRQAYGEEIPLALAGSCQLAMRIDTLSLPLNGRCLSLAPDALARAQISGSLNIERLPFIETKTQKPLTLQHLEMDIQRSKPQSPLSFHLKTTIDAAKPGLAEVRGTMEGLSTAVQPWTLDQLHMKVEVLFQDMPSAVPDLAATLAGAELRTVSTFFGNSLTGSFHADITALSGPISLQINTPATRVAFKGLVHEGVLSLQEPLTAQVTMTEDLSLLLLQKANPLSLDIVTSEGPMTLGVDKEGFSLPLSPWNLNAAVIPHVRIDLGKITCHNKGNLSAMLGLLKLAQIKGEKDLKLWFAPMDISLQQGIVDCSRTEILVANRLDIATWGTIDLVKDRVDAVLGVTAQALQSAFGIEQLPPDYVLQLPMRGSIGHVKIDTGKATAKIAMLLAWQKGSSAAGGMLGGPQGAIVGGLLGKLAQLPDASEPAPPAKHPFPWEAESPSKPSPSKKKNKKKKAAIKPGDKPLKQLLKLIR